MEEQVFYPLIEEKLKTMGRVTSTHGRKGEEFLPDFIIEGEDGKRTAVTVGYESHRERLVPRLLCQKVFRILVHLQRFDRVLYIAPYEQLKIVCDMLGWVNVKLDKRFQTADLGYMVGMKMFNKRLENVGSELRRARRTLRNLEY
ncbi:MAG: hypothetical protein AOA65_0730 [Candidatus Bathyarchaeota archaeon BA1]|nr:MAG: hypothetical protein AOA65_0730 [Candidatus Bathyarchaeota archaeon BA1]